MTLLLLPNLLAENRHWNLFLPASVEKAVQSLDGLIAESETGARRYLSLFKLEKKPHEIPVVLYNEHSKDDEIDFALEPLVKGQRWGLVSDAGLPCIADPGYKLVSRARKRGLTIQAFIGPSAILLSLMLSGLPAQSFYFHGYLPKDEPNLIIQLKKMTAGTTHLFIEAPYRNTNILQTLLKTLADDTDLSIAWDLTMPSQGVITQKISAWKKMLLPNLDKKPAVFLVYK